ncbi:hypothetical protein ACI01nite_16150 [Acetobacter cibinongensis]|uniref:Uroporphyrin-III methyltransferase n=1 Tax=Acetobacter cibinongensis TaxID=146475 RepID=A0A0D6N017_9PROT|nr:DUF488 domain-containing protein [Acetobacter cibinongensis]GAN59264.1 hypothetical protein Abci_003_027 [Acetobacter cibinongensis]GBQ13866.1 hypothetical protein AA0482_0739 [Acetobacter cibinongensis NRIC 0482]GEL59013.1 hypothetical protein ACI01nite_16150 [Acetobacter cibinongensis]
MNHATSSHPHSATPPGGTAHRVEGAAGPIFLRRVYEDPTPEDGARVLVDRLWPRGVSKERAHLTLWLKDIAPSTELREWFGHDPARWEGFQQRYKAEVAQNPDAMAQLVALARKGPVTLLFGARNTTENEAVVLAQLLQAACHTP